MSEVAAKVRAILTRISGIERFADDVCLGRPGLLLDSLDRLDVALQLEEAFDIEISDDHVDDPRMSTPAGIVAYVEERTAGKQAALDAYWAAQTPAEETAALERLRAIKEGV